MNSSVELWLAFLGITFATFLTRSGLLVLGERLSIPPGVEAALRFAPACALAAIIAPDLVITPTGLDLSWDNARWVGGLVGLILFVAFRSIIWTIIGGMTAFWLIQAFVIS
ncbi:MAG: AzlD domain-containing protein [Steroidobacteraceae bacterium]